MKSTRPLDPLALAQINRRLRAIRKIVPETRVRPSWIRYMRHSLRMTLKILGERAGLSLQSVAQAERNEATGKTTIQTLQKMAQAMGCEFVYAFVPSSDIEDVMKKEAIKKATRILSRADTHMTLEDQRLNEPMNERVKRLADELLWKGDVW